MASADFSTNIVEISPGKALIHKVYAGCIYPDYGFCGFCFAKFLQTLFRDLICSFCLVYPELCRRVRIRRGGLPSDLRSPETPPVQARGRLLQLTNGLCQLAHKGFAPYWIICIYFRLKYIRAMPGTHKIFHLTTFLWRDFVSLES